jgi:hypothetical protein
VAEALFSLQDDEGGPPLTLSQRLEAPRIFLEQVKPCARCGARMELVDEEVIYVDDEKSGPSIEIKGALRCLGCEARKAESVQVKSPDYLALRNAGAISVSLSTNSDVTKRLDGVDGDVKRFDIALSFSGKHREYVEAVAKVLAVSVGGGRVFYDRFFEAELARPDLDIYLQSIYRDESALMAVFLGASYIESDWCGLEWRALRDILKSRKGGQVMFLRFDEVEVPGSLSIDGYINISGREPSFTAELIRRRFVFERGA